jgi:hypothetical protein
LVLHTTYVLRVPYSCGVVLVFLVLAGNSFWCYVHTYCTIQLCGCVSFFVVAGKLILYESLTVWTGFYVLTRRSKFFRNASSRGPGFISVSGHETRSMGTCIPEKLRPPHQDMKPGPQGKLMYYYFYHGSDLREIIRFLCKIECIECECNKFVLVLV